MSEQNSLQKQFVESYDELSEVIFRHCFFRVSNREVALDLTQDAFVKTWKYLQKGNDIEDVKAFVYRVANNLVIDYYRKKKSSSLEALTDREEVSFQPTDDSHEQVVHIAEVEQVMKVLEHVEEPYRQAVVLRHVDGLSPREIAELTGETANTISVRVSRGLEKLQRLMQEHE